VASRYGAQFPLMSKVEVNGPSSHPIYAWLKMHTPPQQGERAGDVVVGVPCPAPLLPSCSAVQLLPCCMLPSCCLTAAPL